MTLAGMCAPCTPGTYCSVLLANESETQCVSCPENHYCPEGSIYPVSCPPGEVSEVSSHLLQQCQCPPGFGRYSQQNCTLCPHYFFSLTSSNSEYTQCPENKTTHQSINLLLFLQKQNLATAIYLFGLGTLLTGLGLKHMRICSHHDLAGALVTSLFLGRPWWNTTSPTCLPL